MARIPEAELERLKREVSLERLVASAGIALKRHGADLVGLCPFHDDQGPSLVVSPKKNLWHCLGACQAGGSVIDWVMRLNGISFRHAVELLRADPALAASSKPVRQGTVPKLPAPVALDADDQKLLAQVIGYYHETLKTSPEALAYLKGRGIDDPAAIEHFRLGFANRTLGLRLPEKNRVAGAEIRARLQRLGILRDSGHEHFNGSVVIPIIDAEGCITEVYGRKVTPNLRAGTPLHLYLPRAGLGVGRGVWNIEALAASKEIILCEALIDALTFWCAGYRNVTTAYGVEGFTDDHLAAFKRYGTERVLIAYDRDEAGEKAAERLALQLTAEGIECYRILFPKGMDANEYALKVAPASKSLGLAIRKAVWLGQGKAPERPEASMVERVEAPAFPPVRVVSSLAAVAAKAQTPREANTTAADAEASGASEAVLPATPLPPAPIADLPAEVTEHDVVMRFGERGTVRRYRVRGLAKNLGVETLKVNLLVSAGEAFHVDTLDLYSAKQRAGYLAQAALELRIAEEVIRHDLGRVLLKLEALQEENLRCALAPKPIAAHAMTDEEHAAAMALLRDPKLLDRILDDLTACGLVGEGTNKLVSYLAAVSRKLDRPLAVVIQSSSAAGKSSLMDAVLALMPEEERVKYSAMTGQSLFYIGESNLKHKILAIVEQEGASRAAYALKLLQSEGELTIASTGKDPTTGNLVTQDYRVEGPVMIFLTTTAIEVDEELLNRCLVLTVDEERSQTQAIHRLQRGRRTLEGLLARQAREAILALHRNAQRLLRPLAVVNPYAERLSFPDTTTRLRRDHEKYLTLIDTLALLHQHQRKVETTLHRGRTVEYVEATWEDIANANALAHEVLGRSLDELPPQTRRLLMLIDAHVSAETRQAAITRQAFRFSRRDLRGATGWGDTQLRVHLERLVQMEYLAPRREGAGGRFVYELLYDGQGADGRPCLPGLIDVQALRSAATTTEIAGATGELAGRLRVDRGPLAGGSRSEQSPAKPHGSSDCADSIASGRKTHVLAEGEHRSSYAQAPAVPLAAAAR